MCLVDFRISVDQRLLCASHSLFFEWQYPFSFCLGVFFYINFFCHLYFCLSLRLIYSIFFFYLLYFIIRLFKILLFQKDIQGNNILVTTVIPFSLSISQFLLRFFFSTHFLGLWIAQWAQNINNIMLILQDLLNRASQL